MFPNFVRLPDCERVKRRSRDYQTVRELIRGVVVPKDGRVGVPPWSDLPLNRTLYIPFSIFAYSSNIFITSIDLMVSMLSLGTLKYSRFFLIYSSFMDRDPSTKLTCSTIHPCRCIVLAITDLRDSYCSSTSRLALLLTM